MSLRPNTPGRSRFAAQFALATLVFLGAGCAVSQASEPPMLIIMGASYAKDWKTPPLPGYTVVNKGKGGDDTGQVLARFDSEVLALKPSSVILWGHINNYHRAGGDMDAAKKKAWNDSLEMIRRARAQGITVIIGTEVTLSEAVGFGNRIAAFIGNLRGKEGYSARINKPVRTVNGWLRDYAAKEGLRVLDFEKALGDGEGFRKTEYTTDDGSHITEEGYAELTRYTLAQIAAR